MNLSEWLTLSNAFYLLSGLFLVFAFLSRAMVWLRLMTGISALLGIVYAALIGESLMFVGQIGLLFINLVQLFLLFLESRPIKLPADLKVLYQKIFHTLTPHEFLDLVELGERQVVEELLLCEEGDKLNKLYCILRGSVSIIKSGQPLDNLEPGEFVGEMGFLTHQVCSASAVVQGKSELLVWEFEKLTEFFEEHPNVNTKLLSILGVDVVRKLQYQSNVLVRELREHSAPGYSSSV